MRGQGCPHCAKIQGLDKLRNTLISANGSLADNYPLLLEEWNYEKNTLSPTNISSKASQKVWWICKTCHHEWEATVCNRSNGAGCSICADNNRVDAFRKTKVLLVGSFAEQYPYLLDEWDYEANLGISPNDFTERKKKKVWWNAINTIILGRWKFQSEHRDKTAHIVRAESITRI